MNADVKLKAGDPVTVYRDPLDCRHVEGHGRLVRLLKSDCGRHNGGLIQRWRVKFSDGGAAVDRDILLPRA